MTPSTASEKCARCGCCCCCQYIITRLWNYLSVEPAIVCYLLPSVLLFAAIENLALEKSCRVNFEYPDTVCDVLIAEKNVDCIEFRRKMEEENVIHLLSDRSQVFNETHFVNETSILSEKNSKKTGIIFDLTPLDSQVCEAESRSRTLQVQLNKYMSPALSVFPIILVLYAGGWSDKRGQRRICVLLPMLGESARIIVLLVAAIFFKQLPVQFSSILGALFLAMTGGSDLMLMGMYSYLSKTTTPDNRTVRFSIFAQFVSIVPSIFSPFSGHLLLRLGYVKLLLVCLPLNLMGVYFIIFVMKEPKEEDSAAKPTGSDNGGLEVTSTDESNETGTERTSSEQITDTNELTVDENAEAKAKAKWFVDLFNPTVVIECAHIITRQRENHGRAILSFLFFMYFVSLGSIIGGSPTEYNLASSQMDWSDALYGHYATYTSALGLISTAILIAFFKKCLKFSDAFIGIVSSALGVVTRILHFVSSTSLMFYIAQTFDMFSGLRVLILRSTISTFVEVDEVGRTFSIIAIIEALSLFLITYGYSEIYGQTLKTWPAAIYLGTLLIMIVCALCFTSLYFLLKDGIQRNEQAQFEAENEVKSTANDEITSV